MKIALLADTHLSDIINTPQEEALDDALAKLSRLAPDACVWLGDITAGGSAEAAMRFLAKIGTLPSPSVTVPGNSDIRSQDTAPIIERTLLNYPQGLRVGNLRIVGMNTSHNTIDSVERERLLRLPIRENLLLCSHQSAEYLDEDSRVFLREWFAHIRLGGHRVLLWAHGHSHIYIEGEFEGVPTLSLGALDIDKNQGNAHFLLLQTDGNDAPVWEEYAYTRRGLSAWGEAEKAELRDALGITCCRVTEDMALAIRHGVRHIEWRSIAPEALPLLARWRETGGKTMSLLCPTLGWEEDAHRGAEALKEYVAFAVMAKADAITLSPPKVANEIMLKTEAFERLIDATAEILSPAVQAGIEILIENNHTVGKTPADPLLRPYGCSPLEVIGFRDALRARLGTGACHLRLDVASARRNEPLNEPYPIGKWYALLGKEVRGYHLHQIAFDEETKTVRNHSPIEGFHNGFISFDGFLWAWHSGLLNHAPILLEVWNGESAIETLERLRQLIV